MNDLVWRWYWVMMASCIHHPSTFFFIYLFIFLFIFISWRLITLQYCSGFCHTLTWISHGFTCIPHPDPPSHLPLHPIPLGTQVLSFPFIKNFQKTGCLNPKKVFPVVRGWGKVLSVHGAVLTPTHGDSLLKNLFIWLYRILVVACRIFHCSVQTCGTHAPRHVRS